MSIFGVDLPQVQAFGDEILKYAKPEGWPASPLASWPLGRFEDAILIAAGYLLFVLIGQIIVPLLPPIQGLYPFKFVYNLVQVMLCSYMFIEAGIQAYRHNYTVFPPCNHYDHANPVMGPVLYIFYLSKILDFLDTVFIILEARWKQLSFLHVYHHSGIFLVYWLNINVAYDGDIYYTIVLNGFIHTVMYAYYFVSLHTKDIWWKSAMTLLQMIQFVIMNSHAIYLIITGCNQFSVTLIYVYLAFVLSMLVLFGQFFVSNYIAGKKPRSKSSKAVKKDE